jgi:hypothetical protein
MRSDTYEKNAEKMWTAIPTPTQELRPQKRTLSGKILLGKLCPNLYFPRILPRKKLLTRLAGMGKIYRLAQSARNF